MLTTVILAPCAWTGGSEQQSDTSFPRHPGLRRLSSKMLRFDDIRNQNALRPTPRWPRLQGQRPGPGPGLEVEPRGPCLGSKEAKARVQELYKLPINRLSGRYVTIVQCTIWLRMYEMAGMFVSGRAQMQSAESVSCSAQRPWRFRSRNRE